VSIPDSGSSRITPAEVLERASRSIEEATAQCERIPTEDERGRAALCHPLPPGRSWWLVPDDERSPRPR
jgi:hypothetical protein